MKEEEETRMAEETKQSLIQSIGQVEEEVPIDATIFKLYTPKVETVLGLLSGFDIGMGHMHVSYERIVEAASAAEVHREETMRKCLDDEVTARCRREGRESEQNAIFDALWAEKKKLLKSNTRDAALPKMFEQENPILNGLFEAIVDVLRYYLSLARVHEPLFGSGVARQDPYILVQQCLRFPNAFSAGNGADLEKVLFACLRNPEDDVKVAAVYALAQIQSDRLEDEDVAEMAKVVTGCADISKGRVEDVLRGVIVNLTKIGSLEGTDAKEAMAARFATLHGKNIMRSLMVFLVIKSDEDSQYLSESERREKNELCYACEVFLKAAASWSPLLHDFSLEPYFEVKGKEIFRNEEQKGDPLFPIMIENLPVVADTVIRVLNFMQSKQFYSNTNTRLLHCMAGLLEGPARSGHLKIMKKDVEEDRSRQKYMRRVKGYVDLETRSKDIHGMRRFREEDYSDKIISYTHMFALGDDAKAKKGRIKGVCQTFEMDVEGEKKMREMYKQMVTTQDMDTTIDQVFEFLTIDVEKKDDRDGNGGYKLGHGEMPHQKNFKYIHKAATDDDHIRLQKDQPTDHKEMEEIKKINRHEQHTKEHDVGLCVAMPPPMAKRLCCVNDIDSKGRTKGKRGINVMQRPVQCKRLTADREFNNPHEDGLKSKRSLSNPEICSCWKGATANSALRVLTAIISYGTRVARKAVWERFEKDYMEYAQLILVAYQFGYYQFNIGAKICDIVEAFLVDDNWRRPANDNLAQRPIRIKYYWLAILMCQDMLREVAAKFTFDTTVVGSALVDTKHKRVDVWYDYLKDETANIPVNERGLCTLSARELELLYRVLKLYDVMVRQYPQLKVDWADGNEEEEETKDFDEEDDEEEIAAQREKTKLCDEKNKSDFFSQIFLMKDVPLMIQFVLYHRRAMRSSWCLKKKTREKHWKIIRLILKILGGMYLCNPAEKRYDIIQMLYEFEGQERETFGVGFLGDFLAATGLECYRNALTRFLMEEGLNTDKQLRVNHDEYVIGAYWMRMQVIASQRLVLLLVHCIKTAADTVCADL